MTARGKRHKKHQNVECVYCGEFAQSTEEHVFPRSLFNESHRPSDPIIVPACANCNSIKSGDDSYVRDMMNLDIASSGHPSVVENLRGPIARSIQKNWSQFAKEARIHARNTPYFTDGGIYLGEAVSVPLNVARINRWSEMVARGLYWIQERSRIPNGYQFEVKRIKDSSRQAMFDALKSHGAAGPFRMGKEEEETEKVVSWLYLVDYRDKFAAMWLIWFYQRVYISISCTPSGASEMISDHRGKDFKNRPAPAKSQ